MEMTRAKSTTKKRRVKRRPQRPAQAYSAEWFLSRLRYPGPGTRVMVNAPAARAAAPAVNREVEQMRQLALQMEQFRTNLQRLPAGPVVPNQRG